MPKNVLGFENPSSKLYASEISLQLQEKGINICDQVNPYKLTAQII